MRYFLVLFLFLDSYQTANAAPLSGPVSLFDSILQASLVVQLTLLMLFFLSVACWGIAYSKHNQLQKINLANRYFFERFNKADNLESLFSDLDRFKSSPLARIFKSAYIELTRLSHNPANPSPSEGTPAPLLEAELLDNIERSLRKSQESELLTLESWLSVLATTGSTGPFIGLFGTVWGIMGSFHKIGLTGSASLAVVAPGISEALFTTAIGLVAAIPAVALYNHLLGRLKRNEQEMNNFCSDLLNLIKRQYCKKG